MYLSSQHSDFTDVDLVWLCCDLHWRSSDSPVCRCWTEWHISSSTLCSASSHSASIGYSVTMGLMFPSITEDTIELACSLYTVSSVCVTLTCLIVIARTLPKSPLGSTFFSLPLPRRFWEKLYQVNRVWDESVTGIKTDWHKFTGQTHVVRWGTTWWMKKRKQTV